MDTEVVIKMPEEQYEFIKSITMDEVKNYHALLYDICKHIKSGTPLHKGHGKLIDISKIEEDRIEKDNPIIYLNIGDNYTEAISLDYLNNLPTIIEADKEE